MTTFMMFKQFTRIYKVFVSVSLYLMNFSFGKAFPYGFTSFS